jgi:hypothetical protein
LLAIGRSCLGIEWLNGRSREPVPPDSTRPFKTPPRGGEISLRREVIPELATSSAANERADTAGESGPEESLRYAAVLVFA